MIGETARVVRQTRYRLRSRCSVTHKDTTMKMRVRARVMSRGKWVLSLNSNSEIEWVKTVRPQTRASPGASPQVLVADLLIATLLGFKLRLDLFRQKNPTLQTL